MVGSTILSCQCVKPGPLPDFSFMLICALAAPHMILQITNRQRQAPHGNVIAAELILVLACCCCTCCTY